MFPEFPDDNKNEDFLNEFRQKIAEQSNTSFEERKNELNRSKSVFIGAVSGVVLAGIVGWFVLSPRYAQETDAELPVIRRPQTAIKVQPTEPGGMEILNQDKSVYGILDKSEDNAKSVENLLPPPEEPKLPVITPEEETASIDTIITATVEENANNNIETAQVVEEAEKIIKVAEAPTAQAAKEDLPTPQEKPLSQAIQEANEKNAQIAIPAKAEVKVPAPAAIPAKEEKKTPKSDEFLALTAPAGSWQVQLMSSNNKNAIEKSWKTLSQKYNVLAKQPHEIESADLGTKGTFYRLKAGAFKTKPEADRLCNDIKALGGTCIVKKK